MPGPTPIPPEARFLAKVNMPENPDMCWEWIGYKNKNGYGMININRKAIGTHRYSYELYNGAIPAGLHICHKCDNPACVNPRHLIAETNEWNHRDKINKGRQSCLKGERNPRALITEDDVRTIRRRRANGETATAISKDYPISQPMVSHICCGRAWAHIV